MTLEFTTETAPLAAALKTAARFTEAKNAATPILGNILLRSDDDRVVCSATDLMLSVTLAVPATVVKPGSVTVGAAHFSKIVDTVKDPQLRLRELDSHWVQLNAGKSEFRLMGLPDTDFPPMPDVSKGSKGKVVSLTSVVSSAVLDLIRRTSFSISPDETRPNLNGAFFKCDGATATMVSTDGHRLTKYERPLEGLVVEKGIVIPRRGIVEIERILSRGPAEVEIGLDKDMLFLRAGDLTLSVRLSNVVFPPYQQVIPSTHKREIRVDRGELFGALRRIEVMAPEKNATMRVQLSNDRLELSTDNPDLGVAHHEIDASVQCEPMGAGFNARYLMAALDVIDTEFVVWRFKDELDPCVLLPDSDADFQAVVMPMRL